MIFWIVNYFQLSRWFIIPLFILACFAITYFVDFSFYWLHRFFHSSKCPVWIANEHHWHHKNFADTRRFSIRPIEFAIEAVPVIFISWLLIDVRFSLVAILWALFEASRAHGHYKWFKLIPRSFYKKMQYCESGYHLRHHVPGHEHENMGQMLKVWDKIMNTGRKRRKTCTP